MIKIIKGKAMQPKKIVGKVLPLERDEIQVLFERKNSLKELFVSLAEMDVTEGNSLYEKIVSDTAKTLAAMKQWWSDKGKKYKWESTDKGQWEIDFETCDIFLVRNQKV